MTSSDKMDKTASFLKQNPEKGNHIQELGALISTDETNEKYRQDDDSIRQPMFHQILCIPHNLSKADCT